MLGAYARHVAPIGISKAASFMRVCQFYKSHITISLFQLNFDRTVINHHYILISCQYQEGRIGWRRGGPLFLLDGFHLILSSFSLASTTCNDFFTWLSALIYQNFTPFPSLDISNLLISSLRYIVGNSGRSLRRKSLSIKFRFFRYPFEYTTHRPRIQ